MSSQQLRDVLTMLEGVDSCKPGLPPSSRRKLIVLVGRWAVAWVPGVLAVGLLMAMIATNKIQILQAVAAMFVSWLAGAGMMTQRRDATDDRLASGFAAMNGAATIRLTEAGVEQHWRDSVTSTPWRAYRRIELTPAFLLLFQERQATFVPIAAFGSEDALRAFARFASQRIVAA